MKNKQITSKDIDMDFFQILQDKLAVEFGIASIIVDKNGIPLTNPSNFTKFCDGYIRKSGKGLRLCMECDRYGGTMAAESKKPIVYRCHAGLVDFATPILMGENLIGYFLCGQVLAEKPSIEGALTVAKDIGIPDTLLPGYLSSLEKIRILPYEKIESIAGLVYEFTSRLSKFALYQEHIVKSNELIEEIIQECKSFKSEEKPPAKSSLLSTIKRDIYDLFFTSFRA